MALITLKAKNEKYAPTIFGEGSSHRGAARVGAAPEILKLFQNFSAVFGGIMQIKNFEDLEIWKEARSLTRDIYTIFKTPNFSKDYGLRDQMQRAVVSVMSNIAEGFERGGNQEFVQFLYIAKGSCGEIRSQIYVALDQKHIDQKAADKLLIHLKRLAVMIKHLIDHLKRSGMRGPKYGNTTQSNPSETH